MNEFIATNIDNSKNFQPKYILIKNIWDLVEEKKRPSYEKILDEIKAMRDRETHFLEPGEYVKVFALM